MQAIIFEFIKSATLCSNLRSNGLEGNAVFQCGSGSGGVPSSLI